jgi:hypothetical protein
VLDEIEFHLDEGWVNPVEGAIRPLFWIDIGEELGRTSSSTASQATRWLEASVAEAEKATRESRRRIRRRIARQKADELKAFPYLREEFTEADKLKRPWADLFEPKVKFASTA